MLPYPLVSSQVLLFLNCSNHVLVFFRWNSPSGPCGMMTVKCCKRSFFFLFYLVKLLLYHMMMFAGSCSSHVLLQNVYIREYLLDLLWTSSGRNLVFEFYFKKKYKKIRTHVAKNWSFYYDTKYVQSFFLDRFGISWFLSWQWGKQKRISLLLCRS